MSGNESDWQLGLSANARSFVPSGGNTPPMVAVNRQQHGSFDSDSKSTYSDSSSGSTPSSPQRMFAPPNEFPVDAKPFALPGSSWNASNADASTKRSVSPQGDLNIAKEYRVSSLFHYGNIFLDWGVGRSASAESSHR